MNPDESLQIPVYFRHKEARIPESLFRLCLEFVSHNLVDLCEWTPDGYKLRAELSLPREICEPLVEMIQRIGRDVFDDFKGLFEDVSRTKLSSVHVRHSQVTDDDLLCLLRHNLRELTLSHCGCLTHETYTNIFKNARNLRSLTIGPNVSITPQGKADDHTLSLDDIPMRSVRRTPILQRLALIGISEWSSPFENIFLGLMVNKLLHLRVLDLSFCTGIGNLEFLRKLNSLHTLILYNVPLLEEHDAFTNICARRSLVVLDISSTRYYEPGEFTKLYSEGNTILSQLMECLSNLKSLDISGTNLAGEHTAGSSTIESLNGNKCDIPGLQCRVDNPLEFLGLYNTLHNVCKRPNIPARIITGNANEQQLLNAAASCMEKLNFSMFILNDLYQLLKANQCTQFGRALDIVLEVLERHLENGRIQVLGILNLYHIIKNMLRLEQLNDISVKRTIITSTVKAMCLCDDETIIMKMMRYGLITLYCFKVPRDLMFMFQRLVKLLFRIISISDYEESLQILATNLLCSVVSQANFVQKTELGNSGAIKKLVAIIRDRLGRNAWDEVFEDVCVIMWFMTIKMPGNCEQFLDEGGLQYYLECLTTFHGSVRQTRTIISLINNVAEVKELRPRLMRCNFINVFNDLLYSLRDQMEVKFMAVNVLAHMVSDGPRAWLVRKPSRDNVLIRMTEVVHSWNVNVKRTSTCNSLEPFFKLVHVTHTPQCVHFGVWALANFTKVDPEKYCEIVIARGGLKIMSDLLENLRKHQNMEYDTNIIRQLAQIVINQCLMFTNRDQT